MLTLPTAAELRAMRLRLGLTQNELAAAAGVSQSLIARIEGGGVDPRFSTLRSVVEALNRLEGETATVADVMNEDVAMVGPDEPIARAVRLMRDEAYSQLPVLDDGVPVGSLSETELVRALSGKDKDALDPLTVADLMRPPFPAAAPDEGLESVRRHLEDHPAVVVMEHGVVVGIVTKSDLLRGVG